MNNARHSKAASSTANQSYSTVGILPVRVNTLMAQFLAALLEGRELTGLEADFCQSATRAAAWVRSLKSRYGWNIEVRRILVATNDGRIYWGRLYTLPPHVRKKAFVAGAGKWVGAVNTATTERHARAPQVRAWATRLNAKREAA